MSSRVLYTDVFDSSNIRHRGSFLFERWHFTKLSVTLQIQFEHSIPVFQDRTRISRERRFLGERIHYGFDAL